MQEVFGSIPAWAGKPCLSTKAAWVRWVYPRVGGGTGLARSLFGLCQGLSPRVRGNLGAGMASRRVYGSIPAWAGEPRSTAKPTA